MFLHRMGLQARLDALTTSAKTDERRKQIEQAAKRLVDPTGMGTQYQIMGMTGKRKGVLADEERWPFVDPEAEQDRAQAGVEKPSASQS